MRVEVFSDEGGTKVQPLLNLISIQSSLQQ